MTNLKGINFDIDIDTQLSELKYLYSMDLIYDDYIVKVYNVYYNKDYDFAIYTVDGIELHNVGTIDSCEFVFSFDYCKLYKIKDAVFICLAPIWSGEDNRNPIELFNKVIEHIN